MKIFFALFLFISCNANAYPQPPRKQKKDCSQKRSRPKTTIKQRSTSSLKQYNAKNKPITRTQKQIVRKRLADLGSDAVIDLSPEELREAADLSLSLNWIDKSFTYLKQLVIASENSTRLKNLKLEIADLYFEKGELKKASQLYISYLDLFPGTKYAEYAQYKGILASFYSTLQADRDQSKTKQTLFMADEFLGKNSVYQQYNQEIRDIRKHCLAKLCEQEIMIAHFYLNRGNVYASEKRLEYAKKQYLTEVSSVEPKILTLEYRVAKKKNDTERADKIAQQLRTRFPNHALILARHTPKKTPLKRF